MNKLYSANMTESVNKNKIKKVLIIVLASILLACLSWYAFNWYAAGLLEDDIHELIEDLPAANNPFCMGIHHLLRMDLRGVHSPIQGSIPRKRPVRVSSSLPVGWARD